MMVTTLEDKRTIVKSRLLSQSKNSSVSTYMLVSILSGGFVKFSDLPASMQARVESAAQDAGLTVSELINRPEK